MRTQTHHLSNAEQQLVKTFDDLKLPVSNYNQSYLGFVFPSKQQWEHFTFGPDPGWKPSPALCKPAYSEKTLKDENIVTHLLNNWGHYEKRSCALLSTLALSPCCGVQSIPQSWFQDRLGDHPSLCDPGHPQQRGSQAEMSERTSHEWRPMKFSYFKHKISLLTCSHTPSKGHLHPRNDDFQQNSPWDDTWLGIWC